MNNKERDNKKAEEVTLLLDAVDRLEKKVDILLEVSGIEWISNNEDTKMSPEGGK